MGVPKDSVLTEVPCLHYCLSPEPQEEILLEILKCYPEWILKFQLNCYRIELAVCLNPADFKKH